MQPIQSLNGFLTIITASALSLACSGGASQEREPTSSVDPNQSTVETTATTPTLSGWVSDVSSYGELTDWTPLANAEVCVEMDGMQSCVRTSADGGFQMSHLPQDSIVHVSITAEGFMSASQDVRMSDDDVHLGAYLIPMGTMPGGTAMSTGGGLLVRTIDISDLNPIPGISDGSINAVEPLYTNDDGAFDATYVETGSDGLALYAGLEEGTVALSASDIASGDCAFFVDGAVTATTSINIVTGSVSSVNVYCGAGMAAQ